MVAAAVEKKSKWEKRKVEIGKGTEKELLHFLLATDSKIFAQTLYPQVKKKRYLKWVDSGRSNEHVHGNRNMDKF